MRKCIGGILTGLLILFAMVAQAEHSGTMRGPVRSSLDIANPYVQNWVQASGSARINLTNRGFTGNAGPQQSDRLTDPCTGDWAPQCEFPIGSEQNYLFQAALWIGAEIVDGEETHPRVSVGTDGWLNPSVNEFYPGEGASSGAVWISNLQEAEDCFGNSIYDPSARANFESIAVFSDTLLDMFWVWEDPVDVFHEPLGVEITQSVLSWTSPEFSDLFIVEYKVRNIGENTLRNLYLGYYADADCGPARQLEHHTDDITGFLRFDPEVGDTLNIGWAADNDGRPPAASSGAFDNPHSMGVFALSDTRRARASYNWWIPNGSQDLDYGPSWTSYAEGDSLGMEWTALNGSPMGDVHKYQLLFNGEQDFDQVYADDPNWFSTHPQVSYDPVCDHELNEEWTSSNPPPNATDIANGYDTRFLMSWGPMGVYDYTDPNGCDVYRLNPGEEYTFTIGFLLGPDFHDPEHPQPNNTDIDPSLFDFTGLIASARAAQYLYEHNYEGIVAPPEDFAPTSAGDGTMPLAWSTPLMGDVDFYELQGINRQNPEDTLALAQITGDHTSHTLSSISNGEEWRLLLRTVDLEGYHSAFTDTLVRVGAVLPVTRLTAETVGADVFLTWEHSTDPALASYTVARRSVEGDSTTFSTITNSFLDTTAVNGRHYDYWVLTESDYGVSGVPSLPVHALPFAPQQDILVIEEYYEMSPIDSIQTGIHFDSTHASFAELMVSIGYDYDYIQQPPVDSLVYGLEDLATHDIVIWLDESNSRPVPEASIEERELLFSEYTTAGGHMIRAGKRLLNSGLRLNQGARMPSGYLEPMEFDSIYPVPLGPLYSIQCSGATSLDERFPDVDLNPERIAQQVWGADVLDYLAGVEALWPRGNTWPLYTIEVQEEDTSGFEGEPCAAISENIVLLAFSLYFVEREDVQQLLTASIEGLRNNTFDVPEPPEASIPSEIALRQNYPNPFNPTTTISFSIPAAYHVTLKVYDIMGREVTTLLNQPMTRGTYQIDFNGNNYASGIYFYRLQAGSELQTRKMVLLK